MLQEEDFIRGQQQIEQLQEQSANEEFKSYLAEILGDISQRKLHPDLKNLLVSLMRINIPDYLLIIPPDLSFTRILIISSIILQSFWMIIKK